MDNMERIFYPAFARWQISYSATFISTQNWLWDFSDLIGKGLVSNLKRPCFACFFFYIFYNIEEKNKKTRVDNFSKVFLRKTDC